MKNVRKKLPSFEVHIVYYDKSTKQQKEWNTEIFNKPTSKRITALLKQLSENLVLLDFEFAKVTKTYEVPLNVFLQYAKTTE